MLYRASYVPKHIPSMEDAVAATIECQAPDDESAAEMLFVVANHGSHVPTGVTVVDPLHKGVTSMCPGDLALISALDGDHHRSTLQCDLFGWKRAISLPAVI
jgi:hypothetical protein